MTTNAPYYRTNNRGATDLIMGLAVQSHVTGRVDPRTGKYWDVIASLYCGMTYKAREDVLLLGLGLGTIPRIMYWAETCGTQHAPITYHAVESDPRVIEMAFEHGYGEVPGIVTEQTAEEYLVHAQDRKFDLVIEDTWVGEKKTEWPHYMIEAAMQITSKHGFFCINMLPHTKPHVLDRIKAMFSHVVSATTAGINHNVYVIGTHQEGYDAEVFKRNAARLLYPETLQALEAKTEK